VRGYQAGAQSGASEPSLHKAPALGDPRGARAAVEESWRWGWAPRFLPSAEGLSSPARPAASVHPLPLPGSDVLSSTQSSGSGKVRVLPSKATRRKGGVSPGKGADLIAHHTAGVARAATPSPPIHSSSCQQPQQPPEQLQGCLLSPRCNVSSFHHTISAHKITAP